MQTVPTSNSGSCFLALPFTTPARVSLFSIISWKLLLSAEFDRLHDTSLFFVAHEWSVTLLGFLSSQDQIRNESLVADSNQGECSLEATESDLVLMCISAPTNRSFPLNFPCKFSLKLLIWSLRNANNYTEIKIESVVLSNSMSTFSSLNQQLTKTVFFIRAFWVECTVDLLFRRFGNLGSDRLRHWLALTQKTNLFVQKK